VTIHQRIKFTYEQVEELYTLQSEANNIMSTSWPLSTNEQIQYYRAGYTEAAEAVTWHGFKWWKKERPNLDRLKEELIDILHFAISSDIRDIHRLMNSEPTDPVITGQVITYAMCSMNNEHGVLPIKIGRFANPCDIDPGEPDVDLTMLDLLEQFIFNCIYTGKPNLAWLMALFDKAEMGVQEVMGRYLAKNLLNKFRTLNGAKEGTYNKVWNGKEDNEYLTDYIDQLVSTHEKLTQQKIMDYLTCTYAKFNELDQTSFK
jgi:hypothetical protein